MLGLMVQKIYPHCSNIYTKYTFEKINYIRKHWYKKGLYQSLDDFDKKMTKIKTDMKLSSLYFFLERLLSNIFEKMFLMSVQFLVSVFCGRFICCVFYFFCRVKIFGKVLTLATSQLFLWAFVYDCDCNLVQIWSSPTILIHY